VKFEFHVEAEMRGDGRWRVRVSSENLDFVQSAEAETLDGSVAQALRWLIEKGSLNCCHCGAKVSSQPKGGAT
jgi:hypothetical protein